MTAIIGKAVIEVEGDASKLKAGLGDAKTAMQQLRDTAKEMGESLNAQSITFVKSLEKQAAAIERQATNFGKSKSEIAAYNAAQLGVTKTSEALVARMVAGEQSLLKQAAAARKAADAVANLADQQRHLDTIASKMAPPMSAIDVAAQRGAALGIAPEKLDPLIAKWRAVEMAANEAAIAEKAAADVASFLGTLRTRVDAASNAGKSASDLLELKAAQLGAAESAAPLIAQLRALETQVLATAAAEKDAAAATAIMADQQRFLDTLASKARPPLSAIDAAAKQGAALGIDATKLDPLIAQWRAVEDAATKAAVAEKVAADAATFLGSLQTRVQTSGKSSTELLELKAAQLGVADSAAPMIAQLRAIEAQVLATAAAERDAAIATAKLADQQRFLDSIAARAKPPMSAIDTAAHQGVALGIDPSILDPLIAKWRAVDAAATQAAAAEKAAAEAANLIGSLQGKVQGFGKSSTDLIELKAAEIGAAQAAAPLIAELRALETQAQATAAAEQQAATAARFLSGLQSQVGALGKTNSELAALRAEELGIAAQAAPLIAQLHAQETGLHGVAAGSRAAAAQMQNLHYQIHDFVVQVASGQSPLIAFVQQGSQISGAYGGAGNAFKAVLQLLTPLRVMLGVTVGVVASLALAFKEGQDEAYAYRKALILTGDASGLTVSQLAAMAKGVSAIVGTQSQAADALVTLATNGTIAGKVLDIAAQAAIRLERTTGQAIGDTAKQFEALGHAPVDASAKLNESLHYLTMSTYQQIRAAQEEGRNADAAALAQKAYADAMISRTTQLEANLGTLERGWMHVKDGAKSAWDAMLGIGRGNIPGTALEDAKKRLAELQAKGPRGSSPDLSEQMGRGRTRGDRIASTQAEIAALEAKAKAETVAGEAAKNAAEQVAARVEWDRAGLPFLSNEAKAQREITKARNEGAAAGATQLEIDKRVADIKAKYTDKTAAGIDKSTLAFDLDKIKKESAAQVDAFKNAESILEAQRAAGLVDEGDYYAAKHAFIIVNENEQESALQKEITRLGQEKLSGKEAIDNAKKIADAKAALAKVGKDAAAQEAVLGYAQAVALRKVSQAYRDAEDAAQAYLDQVRRANAATLAGFGVGQQERERVGGRAQIEDRFSDARRALEKTKRDAEAQGTFGADAQAKYDDELGRLRRFQAAELSEYDTTYAAITAKQQDFNTGASEALRNYADEAKKTAKQVDDAFTHAFNNLDDGLVNLMTTGKLNLQTFAKSIQADVFHMAVRQGITGPLAAGLTDPNAKGLLGGLFAKDKGSAVADSGGTNLFAGDAARAAAATPSIDTTTVTASLASLQSAGIDPATTALGLFTQALQTAAGAVPTVPGTIPTLAGTIALPAPVSGGFGGIFAGTSTDPSAPNYENEFDKQSSAATSGENSIADMFKSVDSAQADSAKQTDAFGKSTMAAAANLALFAASANTGTGALSQLPFIMQAISLASSMSGASSGGGGGGGLFGQIFGLVAKGWAAYSGASGGGAANTSLGGGGTQPSIDLMGGRALGGPVLRNSLYRVNERGPELLQVAGKQYLMMGEQGGKVTANADVGNGGGDQRPVNVTNHFLLATPATHATQTQVAAKAGQGISRAMRRSG